MKNKIIYKFISKIKIKISGKNLNRFIMRLHKNKIEILKCTYVNEEEANIIIYNDDYEKVEKLKTIYNIEKIDTYGLIKIKKKLKINKYLILSLILGYFLLIFLSNIIFDIEIIHNDIETRNFLKNELNLYGLKEKSMKKSFKKIEQIKEEILNKYKDKIEWLEIETKGTKYIVRVELRKIPEIQSKKQNQNVIASKDAIIKEVKASSGQIVKEINNYVKKGEVIISGNIYALEEIKDTVPAEGVVFGEVWYEINVTYPFAYSETKELENKQNIYALKIFNKNIELFNRTPFKNKKIEETILLKNNIIPIILVKQKQTELEQIEEILTVDEAINKAEEKAIEKIKNNLKEEEYIINHKILNTNIKESELELNIFFSVYENITEYETIVEEELNIE